MPDDITVIVGGDSAGKAAKNAKKNSSNAQEVDKNISGVNKKEEPIEKKIDRIEKSLTEGMKAILKALNGEGKDNSKKIKNKATDILENISSSVGLDSNENDTDNEEKDAFEKATKITKLKPQDINIVDKQWILGSLLINSTLTDILDFLKKNIKAQAAKENPDNSNQKSKDISGDSIKLGDFMVALEDFMYIAPRILVDSSKELKKVSWASLITAATILPIFYDKTEETLNKIYDNRDKFKDIAKITHDIEKSYINLAIAGLVATLGIPFYLTGALGALAAIPFVAATNLLYKFIPNPTSSLKATLSALLMVPFFAAMWVNVKLASSLAQIPIKDVLMGLANVGIVAAAGAAVFAILGIPVVFALVTLGSLTALAMTIGIFALSTVTSKVAELGSYKNKDILNGMLNLGIIAGLSAAIFGILAFVSPLIAIGIVNAIQLTVGLGAMYLAMRMAIKAGKISDEAIQALGFLDRQVIGGSDPAGKNNSTGIFGFLSKFGSLSLIKLLLLSLVPTALFAIVGTFLTIGGFLLNSGLKQFADIGKNYFPDDKFEKSSPVRGILGLLTFTDILDNGLPGTDGRGKVGLDTVIALVPLLLFGVVLKLAADQVKKGLDAFAKLDIDEESIISSVETLSNVISTIQTKLCGAPETKGSGLLSALSSFLGPIAQAGEYLLQMFPLLMLGLYGVVLKTVAEPLQDGISAMLVFSDREADLKKLIAKNGPLDSIMSIMDKMSKFTKDIATWGIKDLEGPTQAVKTVCESFSIIVPSLVTLANVNASLVDRGISNAKILIDGLFVKNDGFKGAFDSIKNFGKADTSAFAQIMSLVEAINPLAKMVIDMANLNDKDLDRGINAMIKLINAVNQMNGGLANSDEGKLDKLLSIWQNNSGANQIENSPLFKILEILSNKDFANSGFASNIEIMSNGLDTIASSIDRFQSVDISKLKTFADTIGNAGLTHGVNQIERLAAMDPKLKLIANDLQSIANSLREISANSDGLAQLGNNFTNNIPQADKISEITAKQEVEVQSAAWQDAMQNYMLNMYNLMLTWQSNGLKVYMDMPEEKEAPAPDINMSEAMNMF